MLHRKKVYVDAKWREITYGPIPDTGHPCRKCKAKMFSVETPDGGNWQTCGLCGGDCLDYYRNFYDFPDIPDGAQDAKLYCKSCGALSDTAEVHAVEGCTEDVYSASLVTGFTVAGERIAGMPRFGSAADVIALLPVMQLEWAPTCHTYCPKAYYPQRQRGATPKGT